MSEEFRNVPSIADLKHAIACQALKIVELERQVEELHRELEFEELRLLSWKSSAATWKTIAWGERAKANRLEQQLNGCDRHKQARLSE